jgi:GNAT superfamily N-acetyltransferase
LLSIDDLDAALALSAAAGWNQRLEDWSMLLRLAPAGSFAAITNGRIVGTAIGINYGAFGWIAMMLVDPAYRGQGVGRRLLEAAMEALPSDRPIRLDATPMGRPLYQRYGFEDEAMLTRHLLSGLLSGHPLSDHPARDASPPVRRLTAADLMVVTDEDNDVFGGSRNPVLEWALSGAPQYGHVVRGDAGLAHYCLGREGRLFDQIGPVVAGDDGIAAALVNAALASARGRPVVVDAHDSHHLFTTSLRTLGFEAQRPLYRMCRRATSAAAPAGMGKRPALVEFAILGPEFA